MEESDHIHAPGKNLRCALDRRWNGSKTVLGLVVKKKRRLPIFLVTTEEQNGRRIKLTMPYSAEN
jgi:hypothetical protein